MLKTEIKKYLFCTAVFCFLPFLPTATHTQEAHSLQNEEHCSKKVSFVDTVFHGPFSCIVKFGYLSLFALFQELGRITDYTVCLNLISPAEFEKGPHRMLVHVAAAY